MATVLPNPILSQSKFLNWIKAALAVLITKEEIEPVVYDIIEQFQQKCLRDIATSNKLPTGSACSNCSTENLITCPTNKICNVKPGKCSFHRSAATKYCRLGCQNNICHNFKSEIQDAHRYHGPSFKNTDATQWCSNPWEVAKCYMPPDGYRDVANAAETDFNGINSVIINHKEFDAIISDDLSKKNNIFDQGREVGKAVRHSPNLEVEDVDLIKYFTILNSILTDPGFMAINKSQNNASKKLAQLQNNELTIGKDIVCKVLEDKGNVIQEQIRKEIRDYKDETDQRKLALIDIVNTKIKDIASQRNITLTQLSETLQSSVDALDAKLKDIKIEIEQGKQDIKDRVEQGKQDITGRTEQGKQDIKDGVEQGKQDILGGTERGKRTLVDSTTEGVQKLNTEKENALKEIQQAKEEDDKGAKKQITGEITQQLKQEFKEHLIEFYKIKHSSVPLSPLVEEKDTPLAGFYVMPDMVSVKQKSQITHKEEKTLVRSLDDLFNTGSKNTKLKLLKRTLFERNRHKRQDQKSEIYLTADAGFGKTSFSKYLAITWSQACCPDYNKKCFKNKDLKALAKFEFLFLVLLKDTTACSIDEMIEQEIVKKLPPAQQEYPLPEILRKEKCLIILDGLDEWTHPDNFCPDQNEKIPHRYARANCIILTTTRPWKLGVLKLKTSEINKKVELVKLHKDTACQLEKNAIREMRGIKDDCELRREANELHKEITSRDLEHFQTIPLFLMYITCLWCNKIPTGDSKVEVYTNIIEFLLSRTEQKYPDIHPSPETSHGYIPEYFKNHKCCLKFNSLLMALAELACHTLFSKKREHTLVFDGSVAEIYLKAEEMRICHLSGILTGSTTATLVETVSKVSFSHKTVQEFFAAEYISSQSDAIKTVLEKCKTVQSILDMSMICQFLTKMNSEIMCKLLTEFLSVINEDGETQKYRSSKYCRFMNTTPLYNIQKLLLSCLQNMPESENVELGLQDFFIDRDTIHDEHLQRLSKLNKANMKSLYINLNYTSSSLKEVIKLFSLTDFHNLPKIHYYGANRVETDTSELLFPCLEIVTLSQARLTKREGDFIEKFERLQNVQYLCIDNLNLAHELMDSIFNIISDRTAIKELTLSNLFCQTHGHDSQRMFDLSKHTQLKKLELSALPPLQLNLTTPSLVDVELKFINVCENSVLLSRDMLNTECVRLWGIKICAATFREFIQVLKDLPQSVNVKLCNNRAGSYYKLFLLNIGSSKTFVSEKHYFGPWQIVFQTQAKH